MNKKCPKCKLINFPSADACARCKFNFIEISNLRAENSLFGSKLFKRAAVCAAVIIFALTAFYLSLVFSAKPLSTEERQTVERAIDVLEAKGFMSEARLLNYFTVFRSNDNWLNASVQKENAYAAANFPFEIMTLYPDFFSQTIDDTERAAVLLHEARHLKGEDEKEAYEFVWRNRKKLGWTKENYRRSNVWQTVRTQTRENAPNLFVCEMNELKDCTE